MASTPFYVHAIHGGAGYHPPSADTSIKEALRAAISCKVQGDALDVTTTLVSSLELSEHFNAGHGSNLTLAGTVECDASLMDGRTSAFGAVGAVAGVRHPVQVARAVLDGRTKGRDALGRVPAMMLVGEGAKTLARERGVSADDGDSMVSERARAEWEDWKGRLARSEEGQGVAEEGHHNGLSDKQDTVGAVVLDGQGNLAAGVSSGGLLLKAPGRIGEAAIFGAGCYACHSPSRGVAISVSGEGELIILSSLAKSLADALEAEPDSDTHEILHDFLVERFYKKWKLLGEPQPAAGVLLLTTELNDGETTARLWCAFTTPSMAVAYESKTHSKAKATVLRNPLHSYEDDDRPPIFITALPL